MVDELAHSELQYKQLMALAEFHLKEARDKMDRAKEVMAIYNEKEKN